MATGFSTNTSLSALPEYDQSRDPQIYAELVRIRNAFRVLQGAIDGISGFGGNIVSWPAPLAVDQPVVGLDGAGQVKTVSSAPTSGKVLTAQGVGVEPIWGPSGSVPFRFQDGDGSFANINTGSAVFVPIGAFSLTIPAIVGDRIEIEFNTLLVSVAASPSAYVDYGFFINTVDTGWRALAAFINNANTQAWMHQMRYIRVATAGDLSAGNMTVVPGYKSNAGAYTIQNDAVYRPMFTLKNFGQ